MRLTGEQKEAVRRRILESASKLFRMHGYGGVSIDDLMAAAGLTRGGFYVHFKSKADLFAAIVRHEHPLLRMLQARKGPDAEHLWSQMHAILEGYLDPRNLKAVATGCTLAALSRDVSLAPQPVKKAYDETFEAIRREMIRGRTDLTDPTAIAAALALAVGAVSMASASSSAEIRTNLLTAAWRAVQWLLRHAEGDGTASRPTFFPPKKRRTRT